MVPCRGFPNLVPGRMACTLLVLAITSPTAAKTWVVPHVFDTSGKVSTTTNTFDTTIHFTHNGGLPGVATATGDVTVDFYLFDQSTDLPLQSATSSDVCNPCTFTLSTAVCASRKASILVDDLIVSAGGFPPTSPTVAAYAVLVLTDTGDGAVESVTSLSVVANSHESVTRTSVLGFVPQEITAVSKQSGVTALVLDWYEESSASASTTDQIDTEIHVVYPAGLPGGPPTGSVVTIDVYLYDETTGAPLQGSNMQDVCNPCTLTLSASDPHATISMQDLIAAQGFPSPTVTGCALLVVQGDTQNVGVQSFVVNSHTGPFDVSLSGPALSTVAASTPVASPGRPGVDIGRLGSRPNPFREMTSVEFSLRNAEDDLVVDVHDAAGRRVRRLFAGPRAAGFHRLLWDGKTDAGGEAASGVYFARVAAGARTEIAKLTLVR